MKNFEFLQGPERVKRLSSAVPCDESILKCAFGEKATLSQVRCALTWVAYQSEARSEDSDW